MKEEKSKNPAQVMLTKEEYDVVKMAAFMRGFRSNNKYLRHLLEVDVSALKKEQKAPWIFGMRQYDWDQLTDGEKEQFMNQIGPVVPGGLDYMINKAKGHIYDDIPLMGTRAEDVGL